MQYYANYWHVSRSDGIWWDCWRHPAAAVVIQITFLFVDVTRDVCLEKKSIHSLWVTLLSLMLWSCRSVFEGKSVESSREVEALMTMQLGTRLSTRHRHSNAFNFGGSVLAVSLSSLWWHENILTANTLLIKNDCLAAVFLLICLILLVESLSDICGMLHADVVSCRIFPLDCNYPLEALAEVAVSEHPVPWMHVMYLQGKRCNVYCYAHVRFIRAAAPSNSLSSDYF